MNSGSGSERHHMSTSTDTHADTRSQRTAALYQGDDEIRASAPSPAVMDAARRPGLRLPQVIETMIEAYADRPALGRRATSVERDPATGRNEHRLLPEFETITYGQLWADVRAIAATWSTDDVPVRPGDFVATIGFASADYLTVDLVCGYLALVAVPLQHNSPVSRLRPSAPRIWTWPSSPRSEPPRCAGWSSSTTTLAWTTTEKPWTAPASLSRTQR
jgi:fatty acid CoA ligase FadD9